MLECHSPKSSHPLPLPLSPKVRCSSCPRRLFSVCAGGSLCSFFRTFSPLLSISSLPSTGSAAGKPRPFHLDKPAWCPQGSLQSPHTGLAFGETLASSPCLPPPSPRDGRTSSTLPGSSEPSPGWGRLAYSWGICASSAWAHRFLLCHVFQDPLRPRPRIQYCQSWLWEKKVTSFSLSKTCQSPGSH